MDKNNKVLQFRGGEMMSLVPLFILIASAVYFFAFAGVYDTMALALGGLCALIIGSFFAKDISAYWNAAIGGMSGQLGNVMALILLVVGVFGKMMVRGHISEGFIWLGDTVNVSGSTICVFTFVITAIIATSTGTSVGTILTIVPVLLPAGVLMGASPAVLIGAIMSGALFGDSIGPVSDVTIASSQTQEFNNKKGFPDIGGVVKSRAKYSLAAGALAIVLFLVFGSSGSTNSAATADLLEQYSDPRGLLMLIPMLLLLIVAFKTKSIFIAATVGIISGSAVGLISGILTPSDIFATSDGAMSGFIIDGINNMIGTVLFVYMIVAMLGILTECGMMESFINKLASTKLAQTVIGTELIIAFGVALTCLMVGSANGPACIMFGPVANKLGKKVNLHPYRRANLLACFSSTLPTMNPLSSLFIILALGSVNSIIEEYPFIGAVSPMDIPTGMFFCMTFPLIFLISIFTGWGREYEDENGDPVRHLKQNISNK